LVCSGVVQCNGFSVRSASIQRLCRRPPRLYSGIVPAPGPTALRHSRHTSCRTDREPAWVL